MFYDLCFFMFIILFLNMLVLILMGVYFMIYNIEYFIEFNILNINSSSILMTFYLDWMSLLFLGVVFLISSFVILYSKNYMSTDLMLIRFILLILLFIFSMMLLIMSPNLISILLGWDGLGLISYCLVIYYQNIKSFNSGMLTVLSNRIGDVFFLMSIAWMLNFGSWNFIFYTNFMVNNSEMAFIMIFMILAAFTKSAQIPFSSWLPAAMAAPTPVSSLVHSSTLVTAGVYLLIRFENLFKNNDYVIWMILISGLTMFMSGLNANFEYDLKKIIALSTLSQLGLMMSILFLGFSNLAFFHLLTHALFKALLFMCAGIMIHNLMDFQDIRFMGSLSSQMPLVSMSFNFSNLALCGFPFLSGFYSKDLILESIFLLNYNFFIMVLFIISTLFTVMYTFRLIYFSMMSSFNMFSVNFLNDNTWGLNKSILLLLLFVIIGGSLLSWLIFPIPLMICLPYYLKMIPLILIFMGMIMGYYMFKMEMKMFKIKFYFNNWFFSLMWFLPIISTYSIIKYLMKFSKNFSLNYDQSWTEYLSYSYVKIFMLNSSVLDLMKFHFNSLFQLILMIILIFIYSLY
uniref:NADH-ubiquinone oxidoreductase chain 5 n=1 Tax=Hymenoptera sp. 4 GYN-2021 TaxID=2876101 RepID=A0A977TLA2_9HYME|nr:NADH dehydrogenase subunit 5 [Hymenoptera sp. 4 GYN-2021]